MKLWSTLIILSPDYDRALYYIARKFKEEVSKNSLNCVTRTIRTLCLMYVLYFTMSLMITYAFTTSRHYACKSKWFCKLHELWNESSYRIITCYILCINYLLSLGRRQTCLWSPDLRGLYVFGAVWEVPCRSQGNMWFYKTPHDDDYVCDMSPHLIWFIWPPCYMSCK